MTAENSWAISTSSYISPILSTNVISFFAVQIQLHFSFNNKEAIQLPDVIFKEEPNLLFIEISLVH